MNTGLVGIGAHGGDILEIWGRVHNVDRLQLFDEDPAHGLPVSPPEGMACLVGINDPWRRREVVDRLRITPAPPLIDPTAIVGTYCEVEHGSVVAARTLLLRDVFLGEHTHVNYMCSMTRTTIGEFVTVCPGVTICGDVQIGDACLIGAGAVICNLVNIGSNVTVAAGAVIPPYSEIPDGVTVAGVPVRTIFSRKMSA